MSAASPMYDQAASAAGRALALMRRETRVRLGEVPRGLGDREVEEGNNLLLGDAFLLRAEGGIGLFYRKGEGVILERPDDADERDVMLWLNGMLYAAVAAINDLMPVHASAVAYGGRVYAFTGISGAGKSTLAAALGRHGMPLFCDDTLIIDFSGDGELMCLPGHKRLKLWPDGLALSGAERQEQIAGWGGKHFAEPPAGVFGKPLPLAELIFLGVGNAPKLTSLAPGERLARMQDDHYTARLFAEVQSKSVAELFMLLGSIVARVPMWTFERSFDGARFDEGIELMVEHIKADRG